LGKFSEILRGGVWVQFDRKGEMGLMNDEERMDGIWEEILSQRLMLFKRDFPLKNISGNCERIRGGVELISFSICSV
jgi:hypothetical protein